MMLKTRPTPGYAFGSSRRNPKVPETIILTQDECDSAAWVGRAHIDYSYQNAYRCTVDGKRQYVFQGKQSAVRVPVGTAKETT